MNAWKLGGDFPMDQLVRFGALVELDLSNNPAMAGDLKAMFDGLASLKSLQARPQLPCPEEMKFSPASGYSNMLFQADPQPPRGGTA